MSKLGVQNPISAGQVIGAYDASSVADTDWHTLTSDEFYDAATGLQFADNLTFAYVALMTNASAISYIKLRAADAAGDGKTNTDGVIPVFGGFDIDTQAIQVGADIKSIAYAKSATGDKTVIYAGFNK
ncbi:MAG: hypothetical protein CMJ25_31635 [Phycisphaerae bacterium]|nr:hypothetical protein [Phycisphaerae bacterium]|tara:strand:- start:4 stop:387 length:384 start_codon:yes stop_codon:yes gene_type:complete